MARSIGVAPDLITPIDNDNGNAIFVMPTINGMDTVLFFDKIPTMKQVRKEIIDSYLTLNEMEFNCEFDNQED